MVDWDVIYAIVEQAIDEGELPEDIYRGEYGELMTDLKVAEVGFMSLAIDLNGDPLPGAEPWDERIIREHPELLAGDTRLLA